MHHLPNLIVDLAFILAVSSVVALLFRWIKQPVVLGYLIAGVLLGPEVNFMPTVSDTQGVQIWAELGIVFLLFLLGLEFSFKKIFQIGKSALIAAGVEVLFMTLLGFSLGKLLNWDSMNSFFLGSMLAISSTTIIVKSFDELGVKTQSFSNLVFGILVFEDLLAIILLALLSTVASSRTLSGMALLKQVGILTSFLVVVIPVGLWLVPRFFKLIRSQLNDEIRVVVSLGLCLLLVLASSQAGFSPALGAFLMGAFMAETSEGERAERFLKPIRDLFAAIFFTSVGMLVDVEAILAQPGLILAVSLITIAGKVFSTYLGARLSSQDRLISLQAGLSMGQIGEFSFIIATLGLSLGAIKPDLYPLAVAVALITTFTTPYLIQYGMRLGRSDKGVGTRKQPQPKIWDGHLVEFEIHPHFVHAASTLEELRLRERFGVSIVSLVRGQRKILAPSRSDHLLPYDRIVVMGSDAQLAQVEAFLHSSRHNVEASEEVAFGLEKITLIDGDFLVGKNLRESGIREKLNGIVLGVERQQERILNPDSTLQLLAGDVLWIYGNRERLRNWQEHFA